MTAQRLLALADAALERARAEGVSAAEAYVSDERNLTLRMQGDDVQWLRRAHTCGLGLRVVVGAHTGYAYASQPDARTLADLAEQAVANARVTVSDPDAALPGPDGVPPAVAGLVGDGPRPRAPDRVALLRRLADAALAHDPAVRRILRNHYGEDDSTVAVASTAGVRGSYRTTLAYAWVELLASSPAGDHTGNSFGWGRCLDDLDPERIGAEAAEQAVGMLGAAAVPTATVPVVISSGATGNILSRLARMLSAEAVQRGRSLFRASMGRRIAAPGVTLVDDATLPGGLASRPFDGEGVASRRTELVSGGSLRGLLHTSATARAAGAAATGNARRSSYRALPAPGASNLFLQPGRHSVTDLRRLAGEGLQVDELMGLHATNPISGGFSASVRGRWISGGELGAPVIEVTISGEYLNFLRDIAAIGDDLRFYPGGVVVGAPSVLVGDVTVSGL